MALAGMPPLELLTLMYRSTYRKKKELQRNLRAGESLAGALRRVRHQDRQLLFQRWKRRLENARYGRRSVQAVQPCLAEWAGREMGTLTFRTTQVLTGHGCFGEYLCRIGKERTTQCHHCDADHDSVQHSKIARHGRRSAESWLESAFTDLKSKGLMESIPRRLRHTLQGRASQASLDYFRDELFDDMEEAFQSALDFMPESLEELDM
ncbi:uncharacterized protein LOC105191210 [Harpegnathos saltator]|uniref:uncharacterized protein LOC105191210 n=1 Tax=Harpegnathos saltator TaxID=610380 RepID=UPI000DBED659|nr:uncharacterized protein LOC105191210 [Harpegnathos saltator]